MENESLKWAIEQIKAEGAAAERERIRRAVDELPLLMPYGASNAVVRLDDILALLKDGDEE